MPDTHSVTPGPTLSPTFGGDIVWRPTPDVIARAHLTRFMAAHGIASFAALRFA